MPASVNEIVSQMRQVLSITEPELDTTVGTTTRKVLDAVGEVIAEGYSDRYILDYQYDIDAKHGSDLDDFVALFGFSRLAAKRATGTVTFSRASTATQNVAIPYGSQVATTGAQPQIFSTIVPGIIVVGQSTVEIPVQAVVGGVRGNVSAHTVSRRVTPIDGVSSFDNVAAMIGGTDAESDDELRHRFKRTIFRNLAGTEQMFLATALEDEGVSQANVIGASKRHREQIEIVAQTATSTILDAKYIYPGSAILGADIDGGDLLTPDVHYTFDDEAELLASPVAPTLATFTTAGSLPDATYGYKVSAFNAIGETLPSAEATIVVPAGTATNRVTVTWPAITGATGYRVYGRTSGGPWLRIATVTAPTVTFNDTGSVTPAGAPPTAYSAGYAPVVTTIDAVAAPDGIYELEFEYLPAASRNDPPNGVTNRVDVYVNGTRATEATETVVFRTARVFTDNPTDPLYRGNFRRTTDAQPTLGNYFVQFAFTPVIDPATTNTIVIGVNTYTEGTDFFLINDVSENGQTPHSLSGIEWKSAANGGVNVPADATIFTAEYTFNAIPSDVETAVRSWRLITTDVRVHHARPILLNLHLAMILAPGYSAVSIQPDVQAALSDYIDGVGFNGVVQVSDLLEVAHGVPGVDAVRFLTNADDATEYAIQEVDSLGNVLRTHATTTGTPLRAIDVIVGDDRVPALNDVVIVAKAQNSFGSAG